MCKNSYCYCCYPYVYPGPAGQTGPQGAAGVTGATGPFLSGYLEAVGNSQTVATRENITFDTNPDFIDVVGSSVTVNSGGDVFTIIRPGLYSVEWSLNITDGTEPVLVGLAENGQLVSVLTNSQIRGNLSSGALINVLPGETPYQISLLNLGESITLENLPQYGNTSASIRIFRFADGPEG